MAVSKVTRSRAGKKASKHVLKFPQAKGKIIADVELFVSPEYRIIEIIFEDKTSLSFGLDSCIRVFPKLINWKTGNYNPLKRWRPVHSKSFRA